MTKTTDFKENCNILTSRQQRPQEEAPREISPAGSYLDEASKRRRFSLSLNDA